MEQIVCYQCDTKNIKFTSIPVNGNSWSNIWKPICEKCAEKMPDFYYRYIDYGGTYSPYSGSKDEVQRNLERILEREGTNGLNECQVFKVPGKYTYASDVAKRDNGSRVYFDASIKTGVKIY